MRYRDLVVWQKAHTLSLKTISILKSINRSYEGEILAKQLLRAVTSIGANIAEGYGRYEGKEYKRFLRIAYASSCEVENWLMLLSDSRLKPPEKAAELVKENEEILKILTTMIKKLKENSG
jgi:four helix bundle protein